MTVRRYWALRVSPLINVTIQDVVTFQLFYELSWSIATSHTILKFAYRLHEGLILLENAPDEHFLDAIFCRYLTFYKLSTRIIVVLSMNMKFNPAVLSYEFMLAGSCTLKRKHFKFYAFWYFLCSIKSCKFHFCLKINFKS